MTSRSNQNPSRHAKVTLLPNVVDPSPPPDDDDDDDDLAEFHGGRGSPQSTTVDERKQDNSDHRGEQAIGYSGTNTKAREENGKTRC